MSIILFWSPLHGQGQTSNLHVTGLIMGLQYRKRVLMMQTHFTGNNLESPLVGKNVSKNKTEDSALFEDIGLDMAATFSSMNKLNLEMLENCCFSFPDTPLLLLPGTETKNRETFERDIGKAAGGVIRAADECVDMVLVDANSGDDQLSFKLMSAADLIVINLTQHRYVLDKFFAEYIEQFYDNRKVFYLFGDYDDNSCFNINNFRRKYRGYLNSKNSGVIPYCTQFMDSQNESNVVSFMKEGLRRSKTGWSIKFIKLIHDFLHNGKYPPEETGYFFHRSRLSAEKMLNMLQMPEKGISEAAEGRQA
jgi:hypothetical protein